jgi:ribonucleoside-diphosphate reductase alpha chain
MQDKQGVQQDLLEQPSDPIATVTSSAEVRNSGEEVISYRHIEHELFSGSCPDCGSQLEFAEGCKKCHTCGFSECG